MSRRRNGKKTNKKKVFITVGVVLVIVIGIVIWARFRFQGEWSVASGGSGSFGAETYYDGGFGSEEVKSPGIYIRYTANVSNSGTMILAIREVDSEILDSDNYDNVYDLEIIDAIEITGNDTKEIYISSDDYSEVIIHEYTPDKAEAETSYEILCYTSGVTKFAGWLNNITFGMFEEQIYSFFDIE